MIKKIRTLLQNWNNYKLKLRQNNRSLYYLVDFVEAVVVALVFALIIRKYVIQTSLVPTGSMIPTMMIRDRLFVNKFVYRFSEPKRGDIIVFKSPYKDKKDYVKRCIGLPGEKIEVRKGVVYINDKQLVFPGVNVIRDYSYFGPVDVPADRFIMMGDNRPNSLDSRVWGFVDREDILGKAFFTFWPFSRMQMLK
jgi:signal peptidase I